MEFSNDFLIQDVSLDGFEMVNSQYFTRKMGPSMTMWKTAVSFNSASFNAFANCDNIQIMVNNEKKAIIIRPATSRDTNIINWKKRPSEKNYCRLECALFTKRIFDEWKLDEKCRYKLEGRLVQYDEKLMIMYKLQGSQIWNGRKLIR